MTIAAETSKNAHNRPEMCGPVSKKESKLSWTEHNYLEELVESTNCSRYMAGTLVKSILKLKINDLSMAFLKMTDLYVNSYGKHRFSGKI